MTSDPVPLEPPETARSAEERAASPSPEAGPVQTLPGASAPRRAHLRWGLPLAVLLLGILGYSGLVALRETPETREPVVPLPLVRVQRAAAEDIRLAVEARGTVAPRTESDLVAEVRGRVVSLSPQLVVGGFFEEGDELLRLDAREHRIAATRARASVKLRESEARLAAADAERRRQLNRRGASSAADLEQFESRELVAEAALAEARANAQQAALDLERTVVRAPFAGRVRERSVDVGQFVSPGQKLGRIFAVDYAEIRLPIQTDDLAYLDASLGTPGRGETIVGTDVVLTGRLGGRDHQWPARLVRAEAAIDERTRMLHVVARIDDPYALAETPEEASPGADADSGVVVPKIPLPAGLFVSAEIAGREANGVFVLPPLALRDGDRVFVVEADPETAAERDAGVEANPTPTGRLRVRPVSVVRRDRSRVVIDGGIAEGDLVVISPLRIHSDGMALRMVEADTQ